VPVEKFSSLLENVQGSVVCWW